VAILEKPGGVVMGVVGVVLGLMGVVMVTLGVVLVPIGVVMGMIGVVLGPMGVEVGSWRVTLLSRSESAGLGSSSCITRSEAPLARRNSE
jgi:hypothetical protein